ncbi:signaling protein (Consists of PAS, a modified GGDEF and a DHH family phosphatase domains) [Streptococcus thermophilus JIM 8232]|nr:signaling protein (Consists of PAS, a modified GGDEF and a DHH family phosphatase domains) [Streptococcus thermophilus JIM 8232]
MLKFTKSDRLLKLNQAEEAGPSQEELLAEIRDLLANK